MELTLPGPNKGYQKQVRRMEADTAQPKAPRQLDYSSPAARKWPLFVEAVQNGNDAAVKQLVEEGWNVNVLRDGMTPLMLAAAKGQIAIAETLLQAGVNINERNDDGWTALHKAAFEQAGTGMVDLLVHAGSSLDAKDRSGRTALRLAEEKGHRDIVRLIQQHQQQQQADSAEWEAFLRSPDGRPYRLQRRYDVLDSFSGLWWVPFAVLGTTSLLAGLIIGAPVLSCIIGVVLAACTVGAFTAQQEWLRNTLDGIGPLPELDIHSLRRKRAAGEPLGTGRKARTMHTEQKAGERAAAAVQGKGGITVPSAPAAGSAPVKDSRSAGTMAFLRGVNSRLIGTAAAAAVVLSVAGALALNKDAIERWYYAKKLEGKGAVITTQGFLDAVAKDQQAAVELYLKAGISLDARDADGKTALAIASENGLASMAGRLAALDASLLGRTDGRGDTPLMVAARQGHAEVAAVLLQAGAQAGQLVPGREDTATALQAAVAAPDLRGEHLQIIQALLEHGADVNARNGAGRTALMFAVDRGRTEAAGLLMDRGGDANTADRDGTFPLLSASCAGNAEMIALLSDKGADLKAARPDGTTPLLCAVQTGHLHAARALIERGAPVGNADLAQAARAADPDMVKLLLEKGADPGAGFVPDRLSTLKGRSVAVRTKNGGIDKVLERISAAAALDGYRCSHDPALERPVTMTANTSWNKALRDLAVKNNLVVVMKEKDIFIIPYDPTRVRR